jgi:hypothetical protein
VTASSTVWRRIVCFDFAFDFPLACVIEGAFGRCEEYEHLIFQAFEGGEHFASNSQVFSSWRKVTKNSVRSVTAEMQPSAQCQQQIIIVLPGALFCAPLL